MHHQRLGMRAADQIVADRLRHAVILQALRLEVAIRLVRVAVGALVFAHHFLEPLPVAIPIGRSLAGDERSHIGAQRFTAGHFRRQGTGDVGRQHIQLLLAGEFHHWAVIRCVVLPRSGMFQKDGLGQPPPQIVVERPLHVALEHLQRQCQLRAARVQLAEDR